MNLCFHFTTLSYSSAGAVIGKPSKTPCQTLHKANFLLLAAPVKALSPVSLTTISEVSQSASRGARASQLYSMDGGICYISYQCMASLGEVLFALMKLFIFIVVELKPNSSQN